MRLAILALATACAFSARPVADGIVEVAAQSADTVDPIRCWWRTSAGAIVIGQSFEAALTCAAREQDNLRTVPDETRLAAAVIQLPPFEILGGSHPSDLRTATHRYFQYHYTLRVIDRDVIGHDARVPDIQISYRVHTRVNGEWVQGRDRVYIMPGQPVRVLSLVPIDADDIRDSAGEDFARIAGLRYRSRAFQIAAVAFVLIGGVIAIPAVVALLRRRTGNDTDSGRSASRRAVLTAARAELASVSQESRGGWSPDLTARALSAVRLIASCALQRDVAQQPVTSSAPPGRLIASNGLIRRRQIAVSSALTTLDLQKALAALSLTAPHAERQRLEQLLESMTTFTRALYGSSYDEHIPSLDDAVAAARAASEVRSA